MRSIVLFLLIFHIAPGINGQFNDITSASSVDHAHVQSQLFGGGIAAFDFDGDGFEDLFLTGGEGEDKFYLNNREGGYDDFSHILPHNRNKTEITTGVTYADFDRDGCIDLFITSFNKEENCILLKNDCEGGFKEVTNRAGIIENSSSMGATLIDYDLDGDLDIYVINYIWSSSLITNEEGEAIGFDHTCAPNFLYENEGDMRFREVAGQLGVQGGGCALAVTSFNFIDGRPAIYIANDFGEWIQPNELFVYDSIAGTFTDVSADYGLDYGLYGMGITIDDPDRDDDLDIYVSNLGQNAYLVNNGNNHFTEKSIEYKIDNTLTPDTSLSVSWGAIFNDFNNDLWPDLFVANGWIPSASFIKTSFIDPCKYYHNVNGSFEDISDQLNIDFDYINRGVVYTHIDHDGRPDLLLSGLDDTTDPDEERRYRVLKNEFPNDRHFLEVELQGIQNNVEGYGCVLELYHEGEKEIKLNYPGGSYCSHHSRYIHFGLGEISEIDSLLILWPNGIKDVVRVPPINQYVLITEGGTLDILGCMDSEDPYYNPEATLNSGCKLDNTTSIYEIDSDIQLSIFPTVTDGAITIISTHNIENGKMNITDITGRIIESKDFILAKGQSIHFQLNGAHNPGLYFATIMIDNIPVYNDRLIIH